MKICEHCGKEFEPNQANQIYCTKKCREKRYNKRKHPQRNLICAACGCNFKSSNVRKLCDPCREKVQNAEKAKRAVGEDRAFTPDTAFLCQLYRARGESYGKIAESLSRSVGNVKKACRVKLPPYKQAIVNQNIAGTID